MGRINLSVCLRVTRHRVRTAGLPRELAVDLGTASTLVFARGQGVVASEPTVAAVNRRTRELMDIGRGALELVETSPEKIEAVWPMQSGAVGDNAILRKFLTRLLRPYVGRFMERTRVVLCCPSTATPMERRALREAGRRAGATHVYLIEQTIAAALGGDLPVHEPVGTMIVVAGAGITETALLSLGCMVGTSSVRAGGADVDAAIKHTIRREYGMFISDRTAEDIKLAVSQLATREESLMIEASGQMALDGSMVTAVLERDEVQSAVDSYVERTVEGVRECLVQAPPELAQDLFANGIYLAGGSASLGGLGETLADTFSLPVHVLGRPDRAAVVGAGKCLEAIESLKSLFVGES